MEVERAIEHILHIQAQAEARMDRVDRQIHGIQKLIQTGMKLIVRIENAQKRTDQTVAELAEAQVRSDQKLGELAEAQAKSDRKFDRLMEALLKKPPNGGR
jgi:hypothetical protein